ncbi:hypothetical protein [Streptomyces uncialis]|uniref:Uncharacterized protein n=1 Tax=Streptomyces uncialis TaxID=1048205 RepID=A0A1Q4US74_9ACTN|nr:hypothetical protein [Streptomyces uncialis]OKH88472.1 hypothetical protein AB852_36390 [Streptomyces uncialis]
MRTYVGGQEAVNDAEFTEPADGAEPEMPMLEDFCQLFLGVLGETEEQRAVRRAAAGDVLEELRELSGADEVAMLNALYAERLMNVVPMRNRAVRAHAPWSGKAA